MGSSRDRVGTEACSLTGRLDREQARSYNKRPTLIENTPFNRYPFNLLLQTDRRTFPRSYSLTDLLAD